MPWTPWAAAGGAAAETVDGIAGEAIALGQACYLSMIPDATRGKVYLADADDAGTSSDAAVLGLCTSAAAGDGSAVTIQTGGLVETGLSGLSSGKVYGLSSTAGALALTASAPWIGIAESASSLRLSGVYTTTGLTAGTAMGSNASGVLTAGLATSVGYAVSTTELQLRGRVGATAPMNALFTPAPLVYYRWRADTGATATDSSGNSYNATMPASSYAYVTETIGSVSGITVLDWTPQTGCLPLPLLSVPSGTDQTISLWHKPEDVDTFKYIYGYRSPTNTNDASKGIWFRRHGTTTNTSQGGTWNGGTIAAGTWCHLCIVLSGTTGTTYINGAQVAQSTSRTDRARPSAADANTLFGYTENPGVAANAAYSAAGMYADFALFDAALPATGSDSVATLYNGGTPLTIA